jgi:biotin/methionine sulfoxide reductase
VTVQRFSHCSHWGAYSLLVTEGRVVGIEPFAGDPAPSPIIQSVKHWANSAHRIAQPIVREGWLKQRGASDRRPDEHFVPVSWETALRLVADEIDRVRTTYGNRSIFAGSYGWTSCGRFHHAPSQLKRMLNLVGGYTGHVNTYSTAAGPVILRHVLGDGDACSGGTSTLDTIAAHTETLVVFGALSPRTAQNEAGGIGRHQIEAYLRAMKARDVHIVHVSPLRDDLPEWVDAEWWPVRPNTDTAVMLGLAGEIVAAGKHARNFLATRCSGADHFLDYLKGKDDDIPKGAEWAASIADLDAGRIRALAARLVETRSMLTASWSLQRADHGEQPYWAALGLAAVIGQIGLPGGGVGYGYGSLGGVGAPLATSRSPALQQGTKNIEDFIPVARISDMLLHPGTSYTYDGGTYVYPHTRLVYWAGGNPFHHHQDLNRLRRAWAKPETIIVQDPMWTTTARRADIVLPATTSIERNDIAGNRRSDHLIAMHQAIAQVGQSRNDYDIFRELAALLDVENKFSEGRNEMQWLRLLYGECRDDAKKRFDYDLPEFDEFWKQGAVEVPTRSNFTYLQRFREDPDANPLRTETGRILLSSAALEKLKLDDCPSHPAWIDPAEWLGAAAPEQFHLISRQPVGKLHSQLDDAPLSRETKRDGREQVWIHPSDADRVGIVDGETVRIWNERGQCLASAKVLEDVRRGVLMLPTGAWYSPLGEDANALDQAGNPNVLTLDKGTSGFAQGCSAHTCLVYIEPHRAPRST